MMTKQELCLELKISSTTLARMMNNGIPYYKMTNNNGSVRFDLEEVKEWMRENTQKK